MHVHVQSVGVGMTGIMSCCHACCHGPEFAQTGIHSEFPRMELLLPAPATSLMSCMLTPGLPCMLIDCYLPHVMHAHPWPAMHAPRPLPPSCRACSPLPLACHARSSTAAGCMLTPGLPCTLTPGPPCTLINRCRMDAAHCASLPLA